MRRPVQSSKTLKKVMVTIDKGGGAERVEADLRRGLRRLGLEVRTAVGRKLGSYALKERPLNPWHRLAY